jgi:hypothetical protein
LFSPSLSSFSSFSVSLLSAYLFSVFPLFIGGSRALWISHENLPHISDGYLLFPPDLELCIRKTVSAVLIIYTRVYIKLSTYKNAYKIKTMAGGEDSSTPATPGIQLQ